MWKFRKYARASRPAIKPSRLSRQLRQVLIDIGFGEVPENLQIERLWPGHWQRSAGAWLWVTFDADKPESPRWTNIGSCYSATEIVQAHKDPDLKIVSAHFHGVDTELFVERKNRRRN